MMNWFTNCTTVAEIKKKYHRLAMAHHPDRNPNNPQATAIMQAINAAYHAALSALNGETVTGTDNKQHTYYYNAQREQAVMDKLQETIAAGLPLTIELVGTWIWVYGNTHPHRQALKKMGYRWHGKRQKWYFHTKTYRPTRYAKNLNFDDLRQLYGSEKHHHTTPQPAGLITQ